MTSFTTLSALKQSFPNLADRCWNCSRGAAETLRALTREMPHGTVLDPPNVARRYAIMDAHLADRIQSQLLPHPLRTLTEPLPTSPAIDDEELQRTYIFTSDRSPNPHQKVIDACTLNKNWQVIGIDDAD